MTEDTSRRGRSTWVWWTAGKDAAWALHLLRSDPAWEVHGLVTALNGFDGRGVEHGVRRELVEAQAAAAGLPLVVVECAARSAPFSICEEDIRRTFRSLRRRGAEVIAFGDLVPSARRPPAAQLPGTGLQGAYPLAGLDSRRHAEAMFASGLSARVCAIQTAELPRNLVGRRFDRSFLADLPSHVDPCGENREFHTFAEWVPGWDRRVRVEPRGSIECHGFAFADLHALRPGTNGAGRRNDIGAAATGVHSPFDYFERLVRVRRYVDDHINGELTLQTAAAVAALAPSSFGRYFRQRVGMTFRTWLAHYRIKRACQMLRESDAPVKNVGRAVGYRCRRSFRRVFRDVTGYSPSGYRKSVVPRASTPGEPAS